MKPVALCIIVVAIGGCASTPEQDNPARATHERRLPVEPFPGVVASPTCPELRAGAVSTPNPAYPRDAIRIGQIGWLIVEFDVLADGSTSNVRVVAGSPSGVFEAGALNTIRQWKYHPGVARVACRTDVRFDLR
jgi:protein TonB